jgi:hypothetical protein
MPICSFCEKNVKKLKTNSHVIPEWMYKPFYKQMKGSRRLHLMNMQEGSMRIYQKGYKKDFICENCEDIFSDDDNYASKVLTDDAPFSKERRSVAKKKIYLPIRNEHYELLNWSGLNFRKIQKFVFGIIIRTHLTRPKELEAILTNSQYNDIKKFYLDDTRIDDSTFPIWFKTFLKSEYSDLLMFPYNNTNHTHNFKMISFYGCGFSFDVFKEKGEGNSTPEELYSLRIKKDGTANVPIVEFEKTGYFHGAMGAFKDFFEKQAERKRSKS